MNTPLKDEPAVHLPSAQKAMATLLVMGGDDAGRARFDHRQCRHTAYAGGARRDARHRRLGADLL